MCHLFFQAESSADASFPHSGIFLYLPFCAGSRRPFLKLLSRHNHLKASSSRPLILLRNRLPRFHEDLNMVAMIGASDRPRWPKLVKSFFFFLKATLLMLPKGVVFPFLSFCAGCSAGSAEGGSAPWCRPRHGS